MRTVAAIVHTPGQPVELEELELDRPGPGQVLIRFTHAGVCHSDVHVAHGDLPARLPMVLGHEGAGVIEEVGPEVDRVAVGDHVVCSFVPSCGHCRYCRSGRAGLCDLGAHVLRGGLPGETLPFHGSRGRYGAMCLLGAFSQWGVISQNSAVRIPADFPLAEAALLGCGVPTGWGAAVNSAAVGAGDTVIVYGAGGIGLSAVQGARFAGAEQVIAVDPVPFKREQARQLGATQAFATAELAEQAARTATGGRGADSAILAPGRVTAELVSAGVRAIAKGGVVILVGLSRADEPTVQLPGSNLTLYRKSVRGSLFGDCDPRVDIPRLVEIARAGGLRLNELITATYPLAEVNLAIDDLLAGRNVRGVIVHEH